MELLTCPRCDVIAVSDVTEDLPDHKTARCVACRGVFPLGKARASAHSRIARDRRGELGSTLQSDRAQAFTMDKTFTPGLKLLLFASSSVLGGLAVYWLNQA